MSSVVEEAYKNIRLVKATAHIPKDNDSWNCEMKDFVALTKNNAQDIVKQRCNNVDDITYDYITLWEYLND